MLNLVVDVSSPLFISWAPATFPGTRQRIQRARARAVDVTADARCCHTMGADFHVGGDPGSRGCRWEAAAVHQLLRLVMLAQS